MEDHITTINKSLRSNDKGPLSIRLHRMTSAQEGLFWFLNLEKLHTQIQNITQYYISRKYELELYKSFLVAANDELSSKIYISFESIYDRIKNAPFLLTVKTVHNLEFNDAFHDIVHRKIKIRRFLLSV